MSGVRLRFAVAAIALALAGPAAAETAAGEADIASALPDDIPGGADQAAKALKSGVPQLVKKTLEDLAFAQERPVFAPWRAALEGKATAPARDAWIAYTIWMLDHGIQDKDFVAQATEWFESQTSMTAEESARLSCWIRTRSETLADRHLAPAKAGNMYALMALAGNPAAHAALLDLCQSDAPFSLRIVYYRAATYTESVAFRPLFEKLFKSDEPQELFCGALGLLRLGNPDDVHVAVDFLGDRRAVRYFEIYKALASIHTREATDVLLKAAPGTAEVNREASVVALSAQSDERVLPMLHRLRDVEGYTKGVCKALWRQGRAGDIPWLLSKMEADEDEAARTLRHLLGTSCPIEFRERADGVKKWLEAHKDAVEHDAALPLK